ncbi:MAG: acetyl-CoA hydrolase/transferase family protein [Fibrobacteria bacterium]|nr:acetyl-CoA hydrolase/transferase family protein [Fibrobacteria bacterium]
MSATPDLGKDWKTILAERTVSLEEAVGRIRSGMVVGSGHFAGEPAALLEALCRRKDDLHDVKMYHMNGVTAGAYAYATEPGWEGKIRHYSLFAGAQTRKAVQEGRADFVPCFFSEIPRLFRDRHVATDACFVQLSAPDSHGFCSYGVSCDYAQAMIESTPLVIAELNDQMPRTHGERVHVSQLDVIVRTSRPVLEVKQSDPDGDTSVAEAIAGHVSALVPDGANLQLGIGAIPDMVLKFLKGKKDLGIHTEMFSDGILELIDAGVLTGAHNNLHPGKIVATFIMGTKKLYDFVDDNPMILMKPVDYTNSVLVAGRMEKLVSINSAVQVNFHGEVAADTIGFRHFSGVGGQVDFVRSTGLSQGGFSVIAMPSTARGGTVSRIVPTLDRGACVTTSRNDVHYIATEFGCVNLRGRSIRERTEMLISIAHPDFRESLRAEAAALGFVKN